MTIRLNPATSALIQQLKQTASVSRGTETTDRPVTGAQNIEISIVPTLAPDPINPDGTVRQQSDFEGFVLVPNTSIKVGDVMQAARDGKLFISFNYIPPNTNIHYIQLQKNLR